MLNEQFLLKYTQEWNAIQHSIFGDIIPAEYKWTETNEIISVLNKIGADNSSNYTFFPGGGGLNFKSASTSFEDDCIELHFYENLLIKLKCLSFVAIGSDYSCSYFRLETSKLNPFLADNKYRISPYLEHLIELTPQNFIADKYDDYDHLPSTARFLTRILKGDVVIFSVASAYNQIDGTDDGRHAKMNPADFKKYVSFSYCKYK